MFTPPEAEAREASASDPNGKRGNVSAEPQKRTVGLARDVGAPELAEQYEHASPLPFPRAAFLTDREEGYRLGCRDTANALRVGIADELSQRAEEKMRLLPTYLRPEDRAALEAQASELFVQAARIRSAVKL